MKIITIQLQEQVENGTRLNKTVQSLTTTCKREYLNMTNFVIYKGQKSILQEICKCNSTTKPFVLKCTTTYGESTLISFLF